MRGYNVDSAICNHMIRLQSVQLAPGLCLRCKTLKMTPFKTASLVSTLVVLSAFHLYTAQGKFSGDIPPRIADRITPGFRPPAVPLIVVDPYFSVWSMATNLYDDVPRHWLGNSINISGMIAIDEKLYRFMSNEPSLPADTMTQLNLTVYPTQTVYTFQRDGVQLVLTFSTAAIGESLYWNPMTFLTYNVSSIDGKSHTVRLYYDNSGEGAVASNDEKVTWMRLNVSDDEVTMRIGSEAQNYLGQGSDRVDWGYWLVNVMADPSLSTTMASTQLARAAFIKNEPLPKDDMNQPRPCDSDTLALVVSWNLGTVTPNQSVSKRLTVLYDLVYSIRYFGTAMQPMWRKKYGSVENMLRNVNRTELFIEMDDADDRITSELYIEGGSNYTAISSLALRQATGGTVAVFNNVTNEVWMFMKEISSDGDVSTVDVIYPAAPLFLWFYDHTFSPIKLILLPILNYANNNTKMYGLDIPYNLAWAPHHLGHWPICDLDPKHQEQMPMEETGNLLILLAYLVERDGDLSFLDPYWDLLAIWGKYLLESLPDPGDQLCTDDFEGPSPHNVNLAAKGMVGLRAYAYLLAKKGDSSEAEKLIKQDLNFTILWKKYATDETTQLHYRLQYNLPGTWSLKYNLLFKEVMNFSDIFDDTIIPTELEFYLTKMNTFGVPLDDRKTFTKADWQMWVAAMATQDQFTTLTDHLYAFADRTPDRVPFTDWYYTDTAKLTGFRARPVVGGFFSRMLLTAAQRNRH